MPRPRFLALDLDGTLLRHDGSVDPRDAAAVARALASGVTVTIATGRLVTGALSIARSLGAGAPMVCADGGVLACAQTGQVLEERALRADAVQAGLAAATAAGLHPFVFLASSIHGERAGRRAGPLLRPWTSHISIHASLARASAWRRGAVVMVFGVGHEEQVEAAGARATATCGAGVEVAQFPLAEGDWAMRLRPIENDKAVLTARVTERLGIRSEEVVAVGDWFNDLALLAWAGRAFAMSDAPAEVRAAARETVTARRGEGGGVAEAIDRCLGFASAP